MLTLRPGSARGHARHGWLDSRHSFSFADYYDPEYMGVSVLRVINEDRVAPAAGFGTHPHRDMEIISYVLEGGLEHRDSMGNGSVIRPGDVQRMSAGTGIAHSEFNHSKRDPVHFLQIWILPERKGLTPSYEQVSVPEEEKRGRLRLIAGREPQAGAVTVHQDMAIHAAVLAPGESVEQDVDPGRQVWLQVVSGSLRVNGETVLQAGDGAHLSGEDRLHLEGLEADSEVLVFDLP